MCWQSAAAAAAAAVAAAASSSAAAAAAVPATTAAATAAKQTKQGTAFKTINQTQPNVRLVPPQLNAFSSSSN